MPEKSQREICEEFRNRINVSDLSHTFDNFKQVAGTKDAFKAFKLFAEDKLPTPFVIVYGGNGNGKTHLLEATAIHMRKRLEKWVDFIGLLKARINTDIFPPYDEVLNGHKTAEILLIDDVGLGTMGREWETSVLEELIDYRYHRLLKTAMTSNKDITEFTDRVRSRFTDVERCTAIFNKGQEQRENVLELRKSIREITT